jgi:hypothetical protein
MGGLLKNPSKRGGVFSLIVSLGLLALFLFTGWSKKIHPFWAVSLATVIIMGVSTWLERIPKRHIKEGEATHGL